MRYENEIVSIAAETLGVLEHCDKSFLNRIPNKIFAELNGIVGNSFTINEISKNKKIEEQDISEDAKNLIALIYYNYVANTEEKKDILSIWTKNDDTYNKKMDNISLFDDKRDMNESKKTKNKTDVASEVLVCKENIFKKIFEKIKDFFMKNRKKFQRIYRHYKGFGIIL